MIEPGKIYEIDMGIFGGIIQRRGNFFTLDDVLIINGSVLSIKMRRVNFDKMNLSNKDVFVFSDMDELAKYTYTSNDKCKEYMVVDGAICTVYNDDMRNKRAMREFERIVMGHAHQPQNLNPQPARDGYMWNPITGQEELVMQESPRLYFNPYNQRVTLSRRWRR